MDYAGLRKNFETFMAIAQGIDRHTDGQLRGVTVEELHEAHQKLATAFSDLQLGLEKARTKTIGKISPAIRNHHDEWLQNLEKQLQDIGQP